LSPAAGFESDELEDVSDDLPELSDFFSLLVSLFFSLPSDFDEEDEEDSTLPLFLA
jgi:hypothetical protein